MARLYKVNGEYHTFDYLHDNLGYTVVPTASESYKSAGHDDWGTDYGNGYLLKVDSEDVDTWSYWAEGISGWYGLDALAQDAGLYPSGCLGTRLTNGIITSDAVYFSNGDNTYYLIKDAIVLGWMDEAELEEGGWHVPTAQSYIVIDETTGDIVGSSPIAFTVQEQITGALTMPDTPFILIEEA